MRAVFDQLPWWLDFLKELDGKELEPLTPGEARAFACILTFAATCGKDNIFPSLHTIALHMGSRSEKRAPTCAHKAIKGLEKKGLIRVSRRMGCGNHYELVYTADQLFEMTLQQNPDLLNGYDDTFGEEDRERELAGDKPKNHYTKQPVTCQHDDGQPDDSQVSCEDLDTDDIPFD